MFSPLSPDVRGNGMTYQGASSGKDSAVFESYLDKLSSGSFRKVNAGDLRGKDLIGNVLPSADQGVNSSQEQSMSRQLGEKILLGLSNSNANYTNFLQHVEGMRRNNEFANPVQLIMAQALLLNATTSVEFATRAIIKVATVLDTMLRLQ